MVSLASVTARVSPSGAAAVAGTLVRGTEVQLDAAEQGYWKVSAKGLASGWVPNGSFERIEDRAARAARAKAVAGFVPQPGRAVEACPVLLAPDYGGARWGELEDGEEIAVVLPDNDFFGVRLADGALAFVPARSVRLLPEPRPERDPAPAPAATVPALAGAPPGPGSHEPILRPPEPADEPPPKSGPYEALPAGAEPPILKTRVDARFPDTARHARASGEVQLRIVIGEDGEVGSVEVVQAAPYGMTAAAIEAVKRWTYLPARLDGRPIAVVNRVTVRFDLTGAPRE